MTRLMVSQVARAHGAMASRCPKNVETVLVDEFAMSSVSTDRASSVCSMKLSRRRSSG
jgi:hypothetical protein